MVKRIAHSLSQRLSKIDPVTLSRILFGVIIAIALIFASTTFYFYQKYKEAAKAKQPLTTQQIKNPETLLESLGTLMELPTDEEPTIATVADKEKLSTEEFFRKAENGDKVIVYAKRNLGILYRPSINKIIEVGPVDYQEPTPEPVASDSAETSGPASVSDPNQRKILIQPE